MLSVTAHFIDEGKLASVCLSCKHFPLQHTPVNLTKYLKRMTTEWKIDKKVMAVITNSAANMIVPVYQLQYRHVRCFDHSINLIVQNLLKNISKIKKKKMLSF